MSPRATSPARRRLDTLDGLRGIAIVLVVLSHSWQLWPVDFFDRHWWVRPVVRSGNTAVTVFLVVSGFLTYRALASRGGLERLRPGVTLVRRLVRVVPALWVALAVIMLVAVVDPTDTSSAHDDLVSVLHVVTYTWNWYVQGNLVTSRPDFGHLWYLSVDMQAFVGVSLFLVMFRRRPVGVLFALTALWLLLTWWRFHVTTVEPVLTVLVRTTARADAFVLGVLAAALVAWFPRSWVDRRTVEVSVTTAAALLVPLVWWCAADPLGDADASFLGWGGTLLQLDLAALLVALSLRVPAAAAAPHPVERFLARPSLVSVGRVSLLLYVWHYPVFVFVQRHSDGWPWPLRGLVAALLTAVVCVLTHRLVERRVSRVLAHPRWSVLDDGIPAALSRAVRRRTARPSRSRSVRAG